MAILKRIFENPEKEIKKLRGIVDRVNELEKTIKPLTDEAMREKFSAIRENVYKQTQQNSKREEVLLEALPEVFALVREASIRTLGERHFDVQIVGAIVLHQGRISEMKTGEGKTLAATMPLSLNSLVGKGCHIVTVNDYLAKRDSEWMGQIYNFLGLTVGALQNRQDNIKRRNLYGCDILYGTNSEFGFDYLRDNMVVRLEDRVQTGRYYGIVDEVDSILIDEARTPLIISGAASFSTDFYKTADAIVRRLKQSSPIETPKEQELSLPSQRKYTEGDGDYDVDEKERSVLLTARGIARAEKDLNIENLYDPENTMLAHHISQALRANAVFKKDVDYVVKDGQVIIVDEFTGRLMYGRRYSEGLHQAIEAKENVKVEAENQTLATITIQNYYRLYEKLAGMTGTAKTEEEEFKKIYNMDVVSIPTHMPMVRKDQGDLIYKTKEGKLRAIVNEIEEKNKIGQPMLVGTVSVESSEELSERLRKRNIPHNVLNAKHHEREAEIIKQAGQKGMVTIATNMAGRGTDIKLGEGVVELGGLYVIGTERHEARRIDNQLRGRSGRQGDPGCSRFYVSLEDDLMRIFGGDRVKAIMERLGMSDATPIEHRMITNAIENAQKKVENHHFEIRKHVLKYDDVMERQRNVIYTERNKILDGTDIRDDVFGYINDIAKKRVEIYCSEKINRSEWDFEALLQDIRTCFPIGSDVKIDDFDKMKKPEEISEFFASRGRKYYEIKEAELSFPVIRGLERYISLRVIDEYWIRHLYGLDALREGIGLRAYGQTDPLVAYTKESFEMYQEIWDQIRTTVVRAIFSARPKVEAQSQESLYNIHQMGRGMEGAGRSAGGRIVRREKQKVGRNDPCPCGSGKKYKKCCGA